MYQRVTARTKAIKALARCCGLLVPWSSATNKIATAFCLTFLLLQSSEWLIRVYRKHQDFRIFLFVLALPSSEKWGQRLF